MPILTRFTLALLVLMHASSVTTQDADAFGRRSGHPYLLYTDANVAGLKERAQRKPILTEAWQRILAIADAAL